MTDIVIAGYSVAELKKQQQLIKKDASAFIAEAIKKAQELAQEIANSEDEDTIRSLAKEAIEQLTAVEIVATAAGVEYYLPNCGENCYDSSDDVISRILEEVAGGSNVKELQELISQAEDMEWQTDRWNQSYC